MVNIIQFLRKILGLDFPRSKGTIYITETASILKTACKTDNVYISDLYLNMTTKEEAERFSKQTQISSVEYTESSHDCENFSFALMGYWSQDLISFTFGLAMSDNHAFNIFIDNQKKVWVVEPQTNEYMTLAQARVKQRPDMHYFPMKLVWM